mmetsp:Transcript_53414/g.134172  ORF Transcript_53414/g.134172 Transcript_53414/m.134172 type:complete len:472 (+) Transcript_53414:249-1664(+)
MHTARRGRRIEPVPILIHNFLLLRGATAKVAAEAQHTHEADDGAEQDVAEEEDDAHEAGQAPAAVHHPHPPRHLLHVALLVLPLRVRLLLILWFLGRLLHKVVVHGALGAAAQRLVGVGKQLHRLVRSLGLVTVGVHKPCQAAVVLLDLILLGVAVHLQHLVVRLAAQDAEDLQLLFLGDALLVNVRYVVEVFFHVDGHLTQLGQRFGELWVVGAHRQACTQGGHRLVSLVQVLQRLRFAVVPARPRGVEGDGALCVCQSVVVPPLLDVCRGAVAVVDVALGVQRHGFLVQAEGAVVVTRLEQLVALVLLLVGLGAVAPARRGGVGAAARPHAAGGSRWCCRWCCTAATSHLLESLSELCVTRHGSQPRLQRVDGLIGPPKATQRLGPAVVSTRPHGINRNCLVGISKRVGVPVQLNESCCAITVVDVVVGLKIDGLLVSHQCFFILARLKALIAGSFKCLCHAANTHQVC